MWEPRQSPSSVLMGAARSRGGGALGPHILSSPPGTAAPIDAINYTPKTGEIHQPGVLAPVHEQNYSLIPSGQVQGGMGMGAGAAQTGTAPVAPGQERLTGRYSPPPSMASGTNSPGQPPLRPTPYSTGPGPRSQPSGPASAPFGQRGSMAGTAKGWGMGNEMGAGQTDPSGVDLSKVPQTLTQDEMDADLANQAGLDTSGGQTSTPATQPDPSSGGPSGFGQDTPAGQLTQPYAGWSIDPPPAQQQPGAIVYMVSPEGTRIPIYVVTGPPDPATHQPHLRNITSAEQKLITGAAGGTTKNAGHVILRGSDGVNHVWTTDPATGNPVNDLGPSGSQPSSRTATNPAAARNIQPGNTKVVGGYFAYTQQPDGSWKLDQQATQDLINLKAQSGSAAAAAVRAQSQLDTSKLWQVTTLSDGRTVAVDLHNPVKDDGSPNTVELGAADPTKNLYTAGNTVLQYNGDTKQFTPIYTAPSNYSFQTIGGKLMAIDPLDPTKQIEVGQDPYYDATQQASVEQIRANTQQTLEQVASGDMSIETAREALLKDVYDLTHPHASLSSGGYLVPSGANLTVDYGGWGGKGKEEVSGGPLPKEATDLANDVRARLDALDKTRAQRAKDISAPARAQPNQPAAAAPAQPAAPTVPNTAPTPGQPLEPGQAGVPGQDPNLMGQAQPPHNVTTSSGDIAHYDAGGSLSGITYLNTAPPHYGEPGYPGSEGYDAGDVGNTLDVGVTPSEDTGGDTPPDLNVLDSFSGAGQEDFMGRGLTPQAGRGSTGAGWNPQGGMAAGDPLLQRALQRRGKMGMGSGQGPTSPTPAPPGASLQGQTGGAPGWTPPVPPQEVAGIGHRFGQQMDQGEPQHSGVDLQALEGTPTISPVDGVVERVEHNPAGLGLTVIVRGKDGSEHRLGHLSRTKAFPGMLVAQGQDLGSEVGASGNTTGSHLHWGVRDPQGQPVDPTGAMPPQMQQMPPVPGTEMMGPPGGNGGDAQQGAGQIGAGGELEDLLDATKPMDVEKYRTNPMATRRALSMWGGANLGKPSSVWQPLQEWYPSDPGYPGTGQEDWPQDPRGIDYTGLPMRPPESGGIVPHFAGGKSETPFQDTVRWIKEQIKLLDQYGAGQATPMQGGGMASQSPDYQQGYQDGVAASKSPGTPPIFIPSMRQPIPSMSDQQQQGDPSQMGGGQEPDPNMPGWSMPQTPDAENMMVFQGQMGGSTSPFNRRRALGPGGGWSGKLGPVEIDPDTAFGTGQESADSRWDLYEAKDTQGFWGPPGPPPIGSGGEGGMGAGGVYVRYPDGSQHWDETAPDPNPNGGSVVQAGTEHNPGGGKVIPGANRQSGPSGPGGTGPAGSQARAGHVQELAANPSFASGTSAVTLTSGADPSVGSALSGGTSGGTTSPGGQFAWSPPPIPDVANPLSQLQKQVDPFNWNAGILSKQFDPSKGALAPPGTRPNQPGGGNEMGTGGEGGMGAGDVAGVSPDTNATLAAQLQEVQEQLAEALQAATMQFQVGMAQVNANLAAESDRHAEAIAQLQQQAAFHADDVALKQAEDAENTRHNQATEALQAQATQMQQTLEQMKEANAVTLEQMQEGQQIRMQQGDQAFKDWQQRQSDRMSILSSALNNPWLQKLTGLTPTPGANEGVTGGQNLANLIQQVQQPFNPNAPGGGGGGQVFAGQQGAPQIDTPSWSQWQGWDPFQKAAYRTNIEALGPGVWNQVQSGLQSQYASQGGNPNITQMQAAAATPTQAIGQEMTGELFGQTQPAWQASQQKQWSQSQAPNVKQNLSGIAA